MADLMQRVADGEIDPVYILSSDQPLLIERAVSAILDAAVPPELRGFNLDVLEGKSLTAAHILAAVQTLPMMAQRRVVLIRDLAPIPAAELTKLIDYLKAPNPSTVLVAISSKADKRTKFYMAAAKQKVFHDLSAPRHLGAWVEAEAALQKVDMEPAATARLADVVGKDLARLALTVEQLGLYAGDRPVTVDDVDDLIAETRERSVFELTEAIGKGDLAAALAAVAALCEQRQSPVGVVIMLARHMRQLSLCHDGVARRLSKGEIAKAVGVPPFVASKLVNQSRRYSARALAVALQKLAAADRALKGQGGDVRAVLGRDLGERVLLDRLVTELVELGRAREPARPGKTRGARGR